MKPLTYRQKEVLKLLADEEELTYTKGGGWWVGLNRVGGKTAVALLRACVLHLDYEENDSSYQIYSINETGRQALKTGKMLEYRDILKMAGEK